MASEIEVAKLVVRLIGDTKAFQEKIKEAKLSIEDTSNTAEDLGEAMLDASVTAQTATKDMQGGIKESTKAVSEAKEGVKELNKQLEETGKSAEKANNALNNIGGVTERILPKQNAFTNEIMPRVPGKGPAFSPSERESFNKETQAQLDEVKKPLDDMTARVDGLKNRYDALVDRQEAATASAMRFGGTLVGIGTTLSAAGAAATVFGHDALSSFMEAETVSSRLDAIIKANGRNVSRLSADYEEFANRIAEVVLQDDEQVKSLLQIAESMDLTGTAAKRATKNAIGLSHAFGLGERSAVRLTAALEAGDTGQLSRYLTVLRDIKDPAERAAKAQELLNKMFDAAQASTETTAGRINEIKEQWNNFKESIGSIIAEVILPLLDQGKRLADWFVSLPRWIQKVAVGVGLITATVGPFLTAIGTSILALEGLAGASMAATAAVAALKIAMGVGVITAIIGLGLALYALSPAAQDAQDGVKRLKKELDDYQQFYTDFVGQVNTESAKMSPAMAKAFRADKAKELESELGLLNKKIAFWNKEVERIRNDKGLIKGVFAQNEMDQAQEQSNRLIERAKVLKSSIEELQSDQQRLATEEFTKLESSFKDTIERFGKSSDELRMIQIRKLQDVVSPEELQALVDAHTKLTNLEQGEKNAEARESAKAFVKEIESMDLTQVDQLAEKQAKIDQLLKDGTISLFEHTGATETLARHMREATPEFKKAKELVEKSLSPLQKFTKQYDELVAAQKAAPELINDEVFNSTLKRLKEDFEELTKPEKKDISINFTGVSAVEAGSAAALAKIRAQAQMQMMTAPGPKDPLALMEEQRRKKEPVPGEPAGGGKGGGEVAMNDLSGVLRELIELEQRKLDRGSDLSVLGIA